MLSAWEPSETIALTSVIVTGTVAVVAVGSQLYVSWRQRREERRRGRYEELVKAYRETGEALDAFAEAIGIASLGGQVVVPVGTRHKYALLQLHGASRTVLRAFLEVTKEIKAMDKRTTSGQQSTDEQRSRLNAVVAAFYVECNRHLQVVWPRLDPLDLRKPEIAWPEDPIFDRLFGK